MTEAPDGAVIIGAVQTQPTAESKHEKLRLDAKALELAAERAIVLRLFLTAECRLLVCGR